jgi:hypothetical protein
MEGTLEATAATIRVVATDTTILLLLSHLAEIMDANHLLLTFKLALSRDSSARLAKLETL